MKRIFTKKSFWMIKMNYFQWARLLFAMIAMLLFAPLNLTAQESTDGNVPRRFDTENTSDKNLRSLAKVNPSTLALELSLPMMSYPGRNGNSLSVDFRYSSKVWRLKDTTTWWVWGSGANKQFTTDVYPLYAEHSAGGWTSSLSPPRIDITPTGIDGERVVKYNHNGNPYGNNISDHNFQEIFGELLSGSIPWALACSWNAHHLSCSSMHINGLGYQEAEPFVNGWEQYYVRLLRAVMPDGSMQEFRRVDTDGPIQCSQSFPQLCSANLDGTFLSVDGSGSSIYHDASGYVLYMPSGGRYYFPNEEQGNDGLYAESFVDVNGNRITYHEDLSNPNPDQQQVWTDTLGRQIVDPMPHNWGGQTQWRRTQNVDLPAMNGSTQHYELTWDNLKPLGCEDKTNTSCVGQDNITGGALEDQSEKLFFSAPTHCKGPVSENLKQIYNGEVLFPFNSDTGIRTCNEFAIQQQSNPNNNVAVAVRFNPVVLSKLTLPNGQHYEFTYNRYGEISKITYPTGSFEKFVYGRVSDAGGWSNEIYSQTGRGVVERTVHEGETGNVVQKWTYSSPATYVCNPTPITLCNIVTTTQTRSDNAAANGGKTVSYFYVDRKAVGDMGAVSPSSNFGYRDPRAGMPFDERSYDEAGQLRSRVLTEYVSKDATSTMLYQGVARRDLRVSRKVSIMFEPGSSTALATLSETEYDVNGNSNPSYFSHLNVKSQKSYHYVPVSASTAETGTLETIAGMFSPGKLASVTKNEYSYNADYQARGITSLPVETTVMDPAHPDDITHALAKTQTVYDELALLVPDSSVLTTTDLEPTWFDPFYDTSIPVNSRGKRGNPTTTKVWDKENNVWIEKHTQYDQYGNVRKVWEVNENINSSRFSETQYSVGYGCAYPTKVIAPAPDPSNTTGTNQTSSVQTTYDFMTGLPLSVTDDFGQITTTEYDVMLRPTKVNPVVVNGSATGPKAETIYNDNARTVTVKKQIDATNWDESTTYMDSFGRAIKSVAKDSQGDVIVETKYDLLGRVQMVSNPYRQDDTHIYWNLTEYDAAGRVKQTREPTENQNPNNPTGNTLGSTDYGISEVPNYIGTVVTTTDASLRKSRSITNALGQLLRVDEPTTTGGTADADLGPIASPTQPTFYKYDAYGKMVKVKQGDQYRYFKYDSLGRLTRVRQPEQEVNPTLATSGNPDNNSWTAGFTYDVLGNVLTATDANGTVIHNEYDRAGRVVARSYSNEAPGITTPSVNFYYDGKGLTASPTPTPGQNYVKGKLTKVDNGVSATLYSQFDNFGRLKESSQITDGQTYTSGYMYNLSGALVQENYPSGRVVKNEFESDGDLMKVSSKKNANGVFTPFVSNFSYTAAGGISYMRLGNGKWESAQFNSRLQVTDLGLGASGTDAGLWKTHYEYGELDNDNNLHPEKNTGNIARQTLSVPGVDFVQSYRYDSLYRLTSAREAADGTDTWSQEFNYDRYGNRLSLDQRIGGQRSATTTPQIDSGTNRFSDGQGFTYDKNGNIVLDIDLVTNQPRTFVFNGDNKQSEIRDPNGHAIGRYFYDGEGKRVKKITDTETTIFVYSSGKLVAEYSTALPTSSPAISYTTTDHLGSPRIITNQLGNVTSRRDFMPFGEDVPVAAGNRGGVEDILEVGEGLDGNGNLRTTALNYTSTDGIRQKFTGYQKDTETSLDFAEARMYESRYGRFTAVDPLLTSGKSANPQTFNRYIYTSNNPIDRVDVNGKDWFSVKGTYVTYGRTYTTWTPVWRDATANGNARGDKGYFKVQGGVNKGKWITLDPWNNRFTVSSTQADARAALQAYRTQTRDDVIGGTVRAVAETTDLGVGNLGITQKAADYALNAAGIHPDEGSDLYRVSRMGTHTTMAVVAAGAGEVAAARGAASTTSEIAQESTILRRPYIRNATREAVLENAPRGSSGELLDANTRQAIPNDEYHLGHKYGQEFWRLRDAAQNQGLSQHEFNDLLNNPDLYQIEDPINNWSHRYEKPK